MKDDVDGVDRKDHWGHLIWRGDPRVCEEEFVAACTRSSGIEEKTRAQCSQGIFLTVDRFPLFPALCTMVQ